MKKTSDYRVASPEFTRLLEQTRVPQNLLLQGNLALSGVTVVSGLISAIPAGSAADMAMQLLPALAVAGTFTYNAARQMNVDGDSPHFVNISKPDPVGAALGGARRTNTLSQIAGGAAAFSVAVTVGNSKNFLGRMAHEIAPDAALLFGAASLACCVQAFRSRRQINSLIKRHSQTPICRP